MSKRPASLLMQDILESIDKIEQYIEGLTLDSFSKDEKSTDAVVRNLEIIGEATGRLPDEFKQKHSGISWNQIVGLRHRIVHDYFGIDLQIIWKIVQEDLPVFKKALEKIETSP